MPARLQKPIIEISAWRCAKLAGMQQLALILVNLNQDDHGTNVPCVRSWACKVAWRVGSHQPFDGLSARDFASPLGMGMTDTDY